MAELLLELFSEEIPARMQARAADDLRRLVTERLTAQGLKFTDARSYVTPRRLVLVVDGLPTSQPDQRDEKKGPRVGAPEKAVEGFLRGAGLSSLEQCEKRDTGKGEFWFAVIDRAGRRTIEVISDIIDEVILNFPWPKSMRWAGNDRRWVRPLHGLLAIFDGKIIPHTTYLKNVGGLPTSTFNTDPDPAYAPLTASNTTTGHRFMGRETFAVTNFADYAAKLRAAKVMLNPQDRAKAIGEGVAKLAAAEGLKLVPDDGLLAEVSGLVEWPVPLLGRIDAAFMDVPREVLTTSMRVNQKYFTLETAAGAMAPRFAVIANMMAEDGGAAIVAGNEKVLRARLSDARFFWNQDRKARLDSRVDSLTSIVFHQKLGTVADKVARMRALAAKLAPVVGADAALVDRAALLAKADLTTGMVGEFPELQGVMGRYYALNDHEDAAVAQAIADHYAPLGPADAVPTAPVSVCIALADKIDTLTGFFGVGEKPTGSKDPFALRRAALGVIRIVLENGLRLPLGKLMEDHYPEFFLRIDDMFLAQYETYFETSGVPDAAFFAAMKAGPQDIVLNQQKFMDKFEDYIRKNPSANFKDEDLRNYTAEFSRRFRLIGSLVFSSLPDVPASEAREIYEETIVQLQPVFKQLREDLSDFLADRLKVHLRERGLRHDLVAAVFAKGDDDLLRVVRRSEAVQALVQGADGANLLAAYRRAANILRIEEKKDGRAYAAAVDPALLSDAAERELHDRLNSVAVAAQQALAKEAFADAAVSLAVLRAPLDAFFETVTVNADDARIRENRLNLLSRIRGELDAIADFSQIEG